MLDGGAGDDTLYGDSGLDTLLGGAGNDRLDDSGGETRVDGGAGNDEIWIGSSAADNLKDTIVVRDGSGNDTVSYFEFGTDVFEFEGIARDDVVIDDQRTTATDKRVVISWGTTDSVTLINWQDDSGGKALDYDLLTGTTYVPPTEADLTVLSMAAKDTSLDIGQFLALTLDLENLGKTAATGLTTFYWSNDATLDVATDAVISTFDPGAIAGTTKLTDQALRLTYAEIDKANGTSMSGYVFAVIDAGNKVTEANEANNQTTGMAVSLTNKKPVGTNFAITDIKLTDSSLSAGQDMKVNLRVENTGGDAAEAQSYFFWSKDDKFGNGDDVLVGADGHETLYGGESDGTEPAMLSYDVLSTLGDGFIFAVIDPLGSVKETDETDNVSAGVAFTVAAPGTTGKDAPADLAWIKFDPARDVIDDDNSRVKTNWKITNQGETDARAVFTVFWSEDDQYDPGVDVALPIVKGSKIEAGQNDYGKVTLRYNQLEKYGDGYIFAVLDADNLVVESDETNNVSDPVFMHVG